MRNRLVLAGGAAVVVLALVAGGGLLWWRAAHTTALQRAMSLAPAQTARFTFTDWAGVRSRLRSDVDATSSAAELDRFLDEAYDADLSPMSSLLESSGTLQADFGFSPASLEWELLAQSEQGAAVVMQLPEDADVAAIGDRLAGLGYQRPEDDTGVWRGGEDLLPGIGTLTPELQYLALDAEDHLVVASDTERYAGVAIDTVTGEADGFDDPDDVDDVVSAVGDPLAAAVYDSDVVCKSLAMGNASEADQDQADQLVSAAGEVSPLTGFAMATGRDGGVRVAMSFADDDQARANADSRARLAAGPAPGQGGDFADRFRLGRVSASGSVVTMELDPVEGSYVLSDLTSGPVLFATC